MKRKLLAGFMVVCLILTLLPATALAADMVAEVGRTQYETLQGAVNVAGEGDTVKLLSNTDISETGLTISKDKTLVLDLNGKEIKVASTENGRISVYGNLTVQDSQDTNKNGTGGGRIYTETDYAGAATGYAAVESIGENALVTLESGYIYAVRSDAANKGQFGLGVEQGGDLTITGGKVEAGWYAVSGNGTNDTQNSVINIQGGELISTADYAVYLPQSGTTSISGGTIYGAAGGVSMQRGTLNISGNALITSKGTGDTGDWGDGTGGQGCAALNVAAKYDDCAVSISGGTLTAEQEAVVIATGAQYSADISITGGTFSSDVSKFVDSSSSITQREDGSFVVEPLPATDAVASIGNAYYKTLADAINAAKTNDTVTLLQNFTHIAMPLITIPENKNITLDLGGNTLTLQCADRFYDEANNSPLYGYSLVALINHGNLTIQNGTITWATAVSGIANTGNLLIASSAKLINSYDNEYTGHSLIANFGGVVTTAGRLVSKSNNGITTFGGVVKVSGGEILTKNKDASCIDFSNRNYDNNSDHADVTISAGNLESGYFTIGSNNLYSGGGNVTITGGTLTSDITTIYWPASGTLTLGSEDNTQGPTLTAKKGSAIEICSGTLNIYGGKLYGGTEYTSADSIPTTEQWVKDFRTHAGAASGIGDAVTIIARRAGGYISAPLHVCITGGELKSGQNYGIRYMDCNTPAGAEKLEQDVSVSITGGGVSGKIAAVDANYVLSNEQNFITGGYFSSDPADYVAAGHASVASTVSGYPYMVTESAAGSTVVKPSVEEPKVDASAISPDDKTTVEEAAESTEVAEIASAAASVANSLPNTTREAAAQALADKVTVSPDQTVTIYVQTYLEITPTAYDASSKVLTMDITPKYQLVASTASRAEDVELTVGADQNAVKYGTPQTLPVSTPMTVTVTLPSGIFGITTVYVKHAASNGRIYYYKAVSDASGEITFTTKNGFSPFTFSTVSEAVAEIGSGSDAIGYPSFQDALNDVANNGTITALQNITATVSGNKTFTVAAGGYAVNLSAAPGYTLRDNGNGSYTVYTTPSSGGGTSAPSGDYIVSVDRTTGGKVTVNPGRADRGDTVTITADPDNGYVVDEVIVTDKNGDDIRVRDRGDGEYTFTMPDSKVTVEVTFVEAGDELSFVDVAKSDYYYDAVKWAVENGVTTGVTDTIFAPGNPCTRAQTVTFLWRAAGMPQAANRVNPFTDVSVNDYYYEAVLWAVENGITSGTTATTFGPSTTCTRAQVATFLWRYSKEDASTLPMFTDVAESDYYYGAVAWAVENGVTTGVTDTSFVPGNPCTRGQIVTFLYRYMGK